MRKMKITVLDRCTVTTGDVSLDEINTLGDVRFYDVVEPSLLIETIGDSDAVICNKAKITDEIMSACKNLKYVGLFATGYNNIDIDAARLHGVTVCNVPGYSTDSVAQQVFAMILHFATSSDAYNASVARGDWANSRTFSYLAYPITELAGKTLGIFGFGTIGKKVAEIGQAFGMKIIAVAHKPTYYTNVEFVDTDALFARSDYLTLHCPLTEETKHIVNHDTMKMMKTDAVIINTGRGALIDSKALVHALKHGHIGGIGMDVYEEESKYFFSDWSTDIMTDDVLARLLTFPNVIITGHQAFLTTNALKNLADTTLENIRAFGAGEELVNEVK